MAPRKKKKEVVEEDPMTLIDLNDDKDLDLVKDINQNFFGSANKTIKLLMRAQHVIPANKVKYYVEIIEKLHRKYVDELTINTRLRPKIIEAERKLNYALELTAQSEDCMQRLKTSLSEAWIEVDSSKLREQNMQDKMQEMFIKCMDFESKDKGEQDDSTEFGTLAKYKNIILRERDRLNSELMDLEKRLQMQRFYTESLEYINHNLNDEKQKISIKERALDHEKNTLERKNRNLQNVIEDLRDTKHQVMLKLDEANRQITELSAKLAKKVTEIERMNYMTEKLRSENVVHKRNLTKYEEDMKNIRKDLAKNEEMLKALRLEDKIKANTIRDLQKKYKASVQEVNGMTTRLYQVNRTNGQLQSDTVRLKNQMNSLEKDLMTSINKYEDLRVLKENIQRERDNLRSDVVKLNNNIGDLRHTILLNGINIDNLHMDIRKLHVKLDDAKNLIAKAEKERDEMAQEVESLHTRMEYLQDSIQLKTEQLIDLTEKFEQKQKMLINVKKQLEAANSEKLVLKRNLDTCIQERDDFKKINARNAYQITQLSAEIHADLMKINAMNLTIERLNNEKNELETQLKAAENMIASLRKELKEMRTKNESLLKTINEDELKFLKIKAELEETRKERNLVGLQLVRRNDEIILIKEKMSIMQNSIDNGTSQYNQRLEDIRLMKIEILNLQRERECLSRALKSTADMREEIVRLQRLLNQERIRVRSLMEDAKTPTGVHRWRILKGEDPQKYELIKKLQILQKKNLQIEASKINVQSQLKEFKNYNESLKEAVMHAAKGDVRGKLVKTQRKCNVKEKKLKALSAELRITEIELITKNCMLDNVKSRLEVTEKVLMKSQIKMPAEDASSSDDKNEKCMDLVPYSMSQQEMRILCADATKSPSKTL